MHQRRDLLLPVLQAELPSNRVASETGDHIAGFRASALRAASFRPDLVSAMQAFYEETERLIADRRPMCWNKGVCCNFTRLGSRLFVTALEVSYYLAAHQVPTVRGDVCPHAYDGACHVRDHRPLGCRVYHCDPHAQDWQGPLTEERLARLRALHEKLRVTYFYADWLRILRALGAEGSTGCA